LFIVSTQPGTRCNETLFAFDIFIPGITRRGRVIHVACSIQKFAALGILDFRSTVVEHDHLKSFHLLEANEAAEIKLP
jgi:hypothetical protein